jgi:hypothetical protein
MAGTCAKGKGNSGATKEGKWSQLLIEKWIAGPWLENQPKVTCETYDKISLRFA